jgi:two-component system, NarL family, invasion response regulator UvrY
MKSSDACLNQISVIIADDHPVVRQGLATILNSQEDIKVVAEAADGEEACQLYNQCFPDVSCWIFGCRRSTDCKLLLS